MKKKLLLVLLLTFVLACIFAISASAQVVISENNLDEKALEWLDTGLVFLKQE